MSLDLSPALAILRQAVPGLAGVYLFGSHATGDARPDSDVDLAFLAPPLGGRAKFDITADIAKVLSRDVDLVALENASTILQIEVLRDGRLIDAVDDEAVALFELRVLRDYAELKARRAEMEADIVQRGRVHA